MYWASNMNSATSKRKQPAFLTIVTVCYNAGNTISQTIESVLAQTSADYEYLIIDGGSTDATLEIIESYRPRFQSPITVISEPDDGIYDAMNKALTYARGVYLIYINADDWCEPELVNVLHGLAQEGNPDVLCGAVQVWSANSVISIHGPAVPLRGRHTANTMPAHHQGMAVRTDSLRELGGFNKTYSLAADYDLALRLIDHSTTWAVTEHPVANYRHGGQSADVRKTAAQYRRIRIAHGVNPVRAWLMWGKNVVAATVWRLFNQAASTDSERG